ncbi:hypothetical protein JQC92_09280 [Shewanella sp. 202IG2-18]|uniref:hypothetical protein n=1 Tax=Parashewanella hymeniacidonis TaxID=2807618 RepID=UPI001960B45A|nr:hypothetical protein [Parashewanella hymeniacidonis]MBM7072217.1 hypothetical protein [Parashewanella hymeniacidonis]
MATAITKDTSTNSFNSTYGRLLTSENIQHFSSELRPEKVYKVLLYREGEEKESLNIFFKMHPNRNLELLDNNYTPISEEDSAFNSIQKLFWNKMCGQISSPHKHLSEEWVLVEGQTQEMNTFIVHSSFKKMVNKTGDKDAFVWVNHSPSPVDERDIYFIPNQLPTPLSSPIQNPSTEMPLKECTENIPADLVSIASSDETPSMSSLNSTEARTQKERKGSVKINPHLININSNANKTVQELPAADIEGGRAIQTKMMEQDTTHEKKTIEDTGFQTASRNDGESKESTSLKPQASISATQPAESLSPEFKKATLHIPDRFSFRVQGQPQQESLCRSDMPIETLDWMSFLRKHHGSPHGRAQILIALTIATHHFESSNLVIHRMTRGLYSQFSLHIKLNDKIDINLKVEVGSNKCELIIQQAEHEKVHYSIIHNINQIADINAGEKDVRDRAANQKDNAYRDGIERVTYGGQRIDGVSETPINDQIQKMLADVPWVNGAKPEEKKGSILDEY